MKAWYTTSGFTGKHEEGKRPWESGVSWDEVNLFVTFDGRKPSLNEWLLMIGYSFDGLVMAPSGFREWPLDEVGPRFFQRIIVAIFENEYEDIEIR